MKKIFLILLFPFILNAQSNLMLLMSDDGVSYDAETQSYFDQLTAGLSDTRKDTINQFVVMLRDSLSIASLDLYFDRIWILANENEDASLTSLVNPTSTKASKISTPTFTVDRGWKGNGVNNYAINTNFIPATNGVRFTQNNASWSVYSRTDASSNQACGGNGISSTNISQIVPRTSTTRFYSYINSNIGGFGTVATSLGLFTAVRTSATVVIGYQNAIQKYTQSDRTTDGLTPVSLYICANNNNSSFSGLGSLQFAFAFVGKSLTPTEMRKVNNCIEWYLDAIGAGVQ